MWIRAVRAVDRAGGGLWLDLGLYGVSAVFAWITAAGSTLAPHRAWGSIAAFGYAAATAVVLIQLVLRARAPMVRLALAALTWVSTALVPLVLLAVERASGRTDRAQEEVLVVEAGAGRLWHTGTPYLDRADIAALPADERLLAYLPYQPGMALFGIPRSLDAGAEWWSDARVWFAVVTALALGAALFLLRHRPRAALVRALQVATVLPLCALTLAVGGDDLPVLALCLLALAFAATRESGAAPVGAAPVGAGPVGAGPAIGAGLAIGAAAALKLFAWPVLLVLGALFWTRGRRAFLSFAAGAVGVPVVTALPVLLVDPAAAVENVLAFPFGRGLVGSPAASPLPGHLIATYLPGGRPIALTLLVATAVGVVVLLVRRPPRTAAAVSVLSGLTLLAATLLLPSTRFGYLLYPAAFLVWAPALAPPALERAHADP